MQHLLSKDIWRPFRLTEIKVGLSAFKETVPHSSEFNSNQGRNQNATRCCNHSGAINFSPPEKTKQQYVTSSHRRKKTIYSSAVIGPPSTQVPLLATKASKRLDNTNWEWLSTLSVWLRGPPLLQTMVISMLGLWLSALALGLDPCFTRGWRDTAVSSVWPCGIIHRKARLSITISGEIKISDTMKLCITPPHSLGRWGLAWKQHA